MSAIPANAKKPSDRKPKADDETLAFTFEHDGQSFTFKPTYDVLSPGFLRANRRRDEIDAFFTMVEALADEDTLEVIDHMDRDSFKALMEGFYDHLSERSSGN